MALCNLHNSLSVINVWTGLHRLQICRSFSADMWRKHARFESASRSIRTYSISVKQQHHKLERLHKIFDTSRPYMFKIFNTKIIGIQGLFRGFLASAGYFLPDSILLSRRNFHESYCLFYVTGLRLSVRCTWSLQFAVRFLRQTWEDGANNFNDLRLFQKSERRQFQVIVCCTFFVKERNTISDSLVPSRSSKFELLPEIYEEHDSHTKHGVNGLYLTRMVQPKSCTQRMFSATVSRSFRHPITTSETWYLEGVFSGFIANETIGSNVLLDIYPSLSGISFVNTFHAKTNYFIELCSTRS